MGSQEIKVRISMDEGDVLGATPSENLVITRIQHGTLAEGTLQEGDKIIKVDDKEVKDRAHFYRLIASASRKGHFDLTVHRDPKSKEEIQESHIHVPQERIGNLRLRDGFHYKLVNVEYQRGEKIGLGIRDYMNCVVVTKCPEGTMAGRVFSVGDQICDVDSARVTDKGVAQNLIIAALKAYQRVSMVIASPGSEEAKKWVQEALQTRPQEPPQQQQQQQPGPSQAPAPQPIEQQPEQTAARPLPIICRDPPSVRVKSDVRRIAIQEIERRRAAPKTELRSIFRDPNAAPEGRRVRFNATLHQEHPIVNENPGAPLRNVK